MGRILRRSRPLPLWRETAVAAGRRIRSGRTRRPGWAGAAAVVPAAPPVRPARGLGAGGASDVVPGGAGSGTDGSSARVGRRLRRMFVGHLRRVCRPGGPVVVRELVERGAAAGERRGGCRHRGHLLAGGQLGGGVEAIAHRRGLVLGGSQQGFEEAADRSGVPAAGQRAGRHHARHPARRRAELAQSGSAAEAGPHVGAEHGKLLGASPRRRPARRAAARTARSRRRAGSRTRAAGTPAAPR